MKAAAWMYEGGKEARRTANQASPRQARRAMCRQGSMTNQFEICAANAKAAELSRCFHLSSQLLCADIFSSPASSCLSSIDVPKRPPSMLMGGGLFLSDAFLKLFRILGRRPGLSIEAMPMDIKRKYLKRPALSIRQASCCLCLTARPFPPEAWWEFYFPAF